MLFLFLSRMNNTLISSIEEFVGRIRQDRANWSYAWFRGEPEIDTALIPKLYRPKPGGGSHDENRFLQFFRMKAPTFATSPIPDREATDQWLFLAQHVGLPTRLLDWSESALVALHFALLELKPVVWMLNPIELNKLSVTCGDESTGTEFPLTWVHPSDDNAANIGSVNIRGAWELDGPGLEFPVAIHPTNIHPRMSVQRSCFTVHGKNKSSLTKLVPEEHLKRYVINPDARDAIRRDLRMLGVNHSTIFPDLDGLAKELAELF